MDNIPLFFISPKLSEIMNYNFRCLEIGDFKGEDFLRTAQKFVEFLASQKS